MSEPEVNTAREYSVFCMGLREVSYCHVRSLEVPPEGYIPFHYQWMHFPQWEHSEPKEGESIVHCLDYESFYMLIAEWNRQGEGQWIYGAVSGQS